MKREPGQTRLVGVIGGMSWESSVTYYQILNREYRKRLGGHHSAPVLLHSVDFAPIEEMQRAGDWDGTARILIDAAQGLERAGAQLLLLATNTMHLVYPQLENATSVPWIHIADAVGGALRSADAKRPALLGTRFTMERDFYRSRLTELFELDVLVPNEEERTEIDRVIFEELVHGEIRTESRAFYSGVIDRLAEAGADSVILGCTEIGLLIRPEDSRLPVFDTTVTHASAAVEFLLR